MSEFTFEWRMFLFALVMLGGGLFALLRAEQSARRNQADTARGAGRTRFGALPTSARRIRITGGLVIIGGLALLLLASPFSIFHWS